MEKLSHRPEDYPQAISLQILCEITNNFSEDRKIGTGAYGTDYKGVLQNKTEIVVKLLHVFGDFDHFKNEFENLKRLKHQNIIKILGYCYEVKHEHVELNNGETVFAHQKIYRALCFEYAHNGSLGTHIYDADHGLDWQARYKIIYGICKGLRYLHEGLESPMYRMDLKPENILLDNNMVPKLAGFDLSRFARNDQTQVTRSSVGTMGYMPAEYIEKCLASKQFDIFSLGMVIIRIMAGSEGFCMTDEVSSQGFIDFVQKRWRERLQATPGCISLDDECHQVKTCIQIALACVQVDRKERPEIGTIVHWLSKPDHMNELWGMGSPHKTGNDAVGHTEKPDRGAQMESIASVLHPLERMVTAERAEPDVAAAPFQLQQIISSIVDRSETSTEPDRGVQMESTDKALNPLECMLIDEMVEPTKLQLSLLQSITNNFSDDLQIGTGGFAVVYKGLLQNGAVAVKKLRERLDMDDAKYNLEINSLMRVKHTNIVRFLGYCYISEGEVWNKNGKSFMAEERQRFLCFEYLPKGSLDKYVKDASQGLEWITRYQIIRGICDGLHYLHQQNIVHLDLKPANILLDHDKVPKIADFGLSKCFDENQTRTITAILSGSPGYMAPESYSGLFTLKSDIYSLGVIIIEILTGQKGYPQLNDVLESWAARMGTSQEDTVLEPVRICADIGIQCTEFNREKRPAIEDIIEKLDELERRYGLVRQNN